jgi:hypothetical protein
MTHSSPKIPKSSLKISNPSKFYPKLGSSNPKLWVFEPQRLGLEVEAWGLEGSINRDQRVAEAQNREWSRMPSATKGLFDYGWTRLETPWKSDEQKDDLAAVKDFEAKLKDIIFSGDTEQLKQVSSIFDSLEKLQKETRDVWNTNNTINTLANEKDPRDLLSALYQH